MLNLLSAAVLLTCTRDWQREQALVEGDGSQAMDERRDTYNELPSVTGDEVAKRDMSASHTRPWSHTKLGGARPHVHSCLLSPQCWPPWRSRLLLYISWRGRSLVRVGHG